jgi:ubiquinone/menaquinone biosynthesis C-methylase UbiE
MMDDRATISRVTRSKDQAKASYDRLSRVYDALAGGSEGAFVDKGLQKLDLKQGETVLEIGFGTGKAVIAMAKIVGENGKVHGIDISEGMLAVALRNVKKAGYSSRANLKLGEATELHFDANTFDAVFMGFVLELFDTPDIPIVLQECWRVLKKGGRICVVSLSKEDPPRLPDRLYEWSHKRFPVLIDCRPIHVRGSLQEAGFKIEDATSGNMWGLPVEIVLAREIE